MAIGNAIPVTIAVMAVSDAISVEIAIGRWPVGFEPASRLSLLRHSESLSRLASLASVDTDIDAVTPGS